MNKLFTLSYLRLLTHLGGSSANPTSLAALLPALSLPKTNQGLLYRLPREELRHIINMPCPVNGVTGERSDKVIKASKMLKSHTNLQEDKVCKKCPFASECPQNSKPYVPQGEEDALEGLLEYYQGLFELSQPEKIYFRQWVSAYKLTDSIRACVDDLREGGKEIEEYDRVRLEKKKQAEEDVGKRTEEKEKRDEQILKNIEEMQKGGKKRKAAKKVDVDPQDDEGIAFDEGFEPNEDTPVYNNDPNPTQRKQGNKPPKHDNPKKQGKNSAKGQPYQQKPYQQQQHYSQQPRYDQSRPPYKGSNKNNNRSYEPRGEYQNYPPRNQQQSQPYPNQRQRQQSYDEYEPRQKGGKNNRQQQQNRQQRQPQQERDYSQYDRFERYQRDHNQQEQYPRIKPMGKQPRGPPSSNPPKAKENPFVQKFNSVSTEPWMEQQESPRKGRGNLSQQQQAELSQSQPRIIQMESIDEGEERSGPGRRIQRRPRRG